MDEIQRLIDFIEYSEGLKRELRHSWLSNGRQESVADHSWRVALMTVIIVPQMTLELDIEKILKMILVHDLVEIEAGDIPTIQQVGEMVKQKQDNERAAIESIRGKLKDGIGEEIFALWNEFEELSTPEAKFAKAMDKIECTMQKNQQSVDMHEGAEGYFEKMKSLCKMDPFLLELCGEVIQRSQSRPYLSRN